MGRVWESFRWGALALFAACFAYFLAFFRAPLWQPSVDAAWAVGCVSWAAAFWRRDTPTVPFMRQPYWFYALYVAALVPFGSDWRWAMTGDNLSWPHGGLVMAELGPRSSLLSANGADNVGYLQMTLHNTFMLLVEPTIFWHRVGKVVVGAIALASVYTVFARLVRPAFGIAVAGCAATCSVWLVYTYASVPFIDGLASGYALIGIAMWITRDPGSVRAWLALGLLSGFMAFLTPNGWFLALCVWPVLAVLTVVRKWSRWLFALAVGTTVIVATPMLLQWAQGGGGQLFTLVQNPGWTAEKVLRFLSEAAFIPFLSDLRGAGAFGPQLPWGFRWLFVVGILMTPIINRDRFPGARWILAIYVVQVLILAFAQGPYAGVSVKRALVLIPMAVYFTLLPFQQWIRSAPGALVVVAAWAVFGVYDIATKMQPGRTGYTLVDGAIEAHRRFAPDPVCVLISKDDFAHQLVAGSVVDRLYGLTPRLVHVHDSADPRCGAVLCYSPQIDQVDLAALGYPEVPMQGTTELRCGRRYGR